MSTVNPVLPIEEPIDVLVGRRVHSLMWEARMKNKEMAELLGIDPTAIGKKLRAEQKFSIEQLRVVARRLDTTIAYLVGEAENPHQFPGGGSSLPGLDSNQEPAGFKPSAQPIVSLAEHRAAKETAA